jgi:hypothetical protein
MRQLSKLTVLAAVGLLALPALAFDVAEISLKEFDDGSIAEYESSFCEVMVGDRVVVTLVGDGGGGDADIAMIEAVELKKGNNQATPSRGQGPEGAKGGPRTAEITPMISADARSVEITLNAATDGWRTVHVRLELDTGGRLGVNLHSTPCEPEVDETGEGM